MCFFKKQYQGTSLDGAHDTLTLPKKAIGMLSGGSETSISEFSGSSLERIYLI
jgi:hypothetical protein